MDHDSAKTVIHDMDKNKEHMDTAMAMEFF